MGKLNDQLEADLKRAMLAGDKQLVSTLRGLKSAIQYESIRADAQLSEQEIIRVLQKESKKRTDAIELYVRANDSDRAEKEENEKKIIDGYLPELLSREEVSRLVDEAIDQQGSLEQKNMGKIIAEVRQKSNGLADGSLIAQLVKERLGQ